ncbi:hypothetical protein CDAR_411771 [Caerostris darwini]|uniref:Uncharacterized protein n=1 Tax=Caerostris darwini TaxID=1538125 RepID=A0AAV4R6F9_9ARAC|nr:hypothetical protein CDAR_411771 [Caerostris darwini]
MRVRCSLKRNKSHIDTRKEVSEKKWLLLETKSWKGIAKSHTTIFGALKEIIFEMFAIYISWDFLFSFLESIFEKLFRIIFVWRSGFLLQVLEVEREDKNNPSMALSVR